MIRRSDAAPDGATLSATLPDGKRCTKESVAGRLREFLETAGLTQPAAAAKAGKMPLPSFKDYVAGNRMPGGEALAALALLGINLNWLLTGDGEMLILDEAHSVTYDQSDSGSGIPDFLRLNGQISYSPAEPRGGTVTSSNFDSLLLEAVMKVFFDYLEQHKDRVRIDRDRHAAVIAVLYKIAANSGKADKAELEQVLRAAA